MCKSNQQTHARDWKSERTDRTKGERKKNHMNNKNTIITAFITFLWQILQIVNFDLICYNIYFPPMDCNRQWVAHMYYIIELTRKIVVNDPKKEHTDTDTDSDTHTHVQSANFLCIAMLSLVKSGNHPATQRSKQ